jgi:hypothetical protein
MTTKILILAANPKDTMRLRLDEEVREIESGLQRAQKRESFEIKAQWATRIHDVRRAMLDFCPNIVHFCGHGKREAGIKFEDDLGESHVVSAEALAGFFKLFAEDVQCVVLNACYSKVQAEAIAQHIPSVIGMSDEIGDKTAIEFAVAFYDALGAGRTVEFAYELACNAIQMAGIPSSEGQGVGIPEHLIPVLFTVGQDRKKVCDRLIQQLSETSLPKPLSELTKSLLEEIKQDTHFDLKGLMISYSFHGGYYLPSLWRHNEKIDKSLYPDRSLVEIRKIDAALRELVENNILREYYKGTRDNTVALYILWEPAKPIIEKLADSLLEKIKQDPHTDRPKGLTILPYNDEKTKGWYVPYLHNELEQPDPTDNIIGICLAAQMLEEKGYLERLKEPGSKIKYILLDSYK